MSRWRRKYILYVTVLASCRLSLALRCLPHLDLVEPGSEAQPAAWALPGRWVALQTLQPHHRPTESESVLARGRQVIHVPIKVRGALF